MDVPVLSSFQMSVFRNILDSFMKSKHLFIYLGRFFFFIKRFLYSSDLHILRKSPPNLRSYVETLSHSSILSEKNSLLYLSSDSLRSIPSYILKRCLYHGYDILERVSTIWFVVVRVVLSCILLKPWLRKPHTKDITEMTCMWSSSVRLSMQPFSVVRMVKYKI